MHNQIAKERKCIMEKVSTHFVANFSTEEIPQSVIGLWRNWIFCGSISPILDYGHEKDIAKALEKSANDENKISRRK